MLSLFLLIVRHGMAIFGAYLTAHGVNASSTESIVLGLVALAVPIVWSFVAKMFKFDETWKFDPTLSEKLRTALGSLVSQGITFASAYYSIDAHDPSALVIAVINAIASHYGVHQQIAHSTPLDVATAIKVFVAGFCVLTLSSCAGALALLANPAVDSMAISLVELGLDEAVSKGVVTPGQVVTIKKAGAVITDPNDSTVNKAVKLEDIGLDVAVAAGKLSPGDSLFIKDATAVVQKAVTPGAKQPVKVAPVKTASARVRSGQECPRSPRDVPGCMQLAGGVPLYGERVAFVLRTGEVR